MGPTGAGAATRCCAELGDGAGWARGKAGPRDALGSAGSRVGKRDGCSAVGSGHARRFSSLDERSDRDAACRTKAEKKKEAIQSRPNFGRSYRLIAGRKSRRADKRRSHEPGRCRIADGSYRAGVHWRRPSAHGPLGLARSIRRQPPPLPPLPPRRGPSSFQGEQAGCGWRR